MQAALIDITAFIVLVGLIIGWDYWKKSAARAQVATAERRRSGVDQVVCGSCGNRNAEPVKVRTRAGSAILGGLIFSRKARAQFHCRTCNSYW